MIKRDDCFIIVKVCPIELYQFLDSTQCVMNFFIACFTHKLPVTFISHSRPIVAIQRVAENPEKHLRDLVMHQGCQIVQPVQQHLRSNHQAMPANDSY